MLKPYKLNICIPLNLMSIIINHPELSLDEEFDIFSSHFSTKFGHFNSRSSSAAEQFCAKKINDPAEVSKAQV